MRYHWHRLKRSSDSPKAVAAGFAVGAAMGITPFIGLHVWMALALSWLFEASLLATFVGTLIGNYLTIIPILMVEYNLGRGVLRLFGATPDVLHGHVTLWFMVEHPARFTREMLAAPQDFWPLIWPLMIGSLIGATLVYVTSFYMVKGSIQRWRHHRHKFLQEKRRERLSL